MLIAGSGTLIGGSGNAAFSRPPRHLSPCNRRCQSKCSFFLHGRDFGAQGRRMRLDHTHNLIYAPTVLDTHRGVVESCENPALLIARERVSRCDSFVLDSNIVSDGKLGCAAYSGSDGVNPRQHAPSHPATALTTRRGLLEVVSPPSPRPPITALHGSWGRRGCYGPNMCS